MEEQGNSEVRVTERSNGKVNPIRRSSSSAKLDAVMAKISLKMGSVTKEADNPFFHSKYADLDSVRKTIVAAMEASGVSVLIQQFPITNYENPVNKTVVIKNRNGDYVKDIQILVPIITVTTRITEPETGEWQESDFSLTPAEDTPQAIGSAITYLRRYSLMPLYNIAPADDDGNAGSGRDPMNQDPKGQPPKAIGAPRTVSPAPARPVAPVKTSETHTQVTPQKPTEPTGPRPLTDAERKHLGLIDGQQFDALKELCKKKGIDAKKWKLWLSVTHGINSMADIKSTEYSGVIETVTAHPEKIMNVKEPREPGADEEEPIPEDELYGHIRTPTSKR
jgi:hypothetical protein